MEPVVGSADDEEEEGVLRSALTSLQHCLVKFGLVPSRVIAFMRPVTTDSDDSVQFPSKSDLLLFFQQKCLCKADLLFLW